MGVKFYKNETFHHDKFYNTFLHESEACGSLHTQDFYEITLTYSDNIVYHINGEKVVCPSGTLVFARPGDTHCWRALDGKAFSYFNLSFTPATFNEILSFLGAEDYRKSLENHLVKVKLSSKQTSKLVSRLKKINGVGWSGAHKIQFYVKTLLADVFSKYFLSGESLNGLPVWLSELCDWIKLDMNFALSLEEIAKRAGKSKEHLCRSVKRYLNVTVKQYVNDIRCSYVASMLGHTDIPIIDLWMQAGFNSGSYFNKLFKNMYGMSAQEYRKLESRENQY